MAKKRGVPKEQRPIYVASFDGSVDFETFRILAAKANLKFVPFKLAAEPELLTEEEGRGRALRRLRELNAARGGSDAAIESNIRKLEAQPHVEVSKLKKRPAGATIARHWLHDYRLKNSPHFGAAGAFQGYREWFESLDPWLQQQFIDYMFTSLTGVSERSSGRGQGKAKYAGQLYERLAEDASRRRDELKISKVAAVRLVVDEHLASGATLSSKEAAITAVCRLIPRRAAAVPPKKPADIN